jgi:protoheme ferro-lyase
MMAHTITYYNDNPYERYARCRCGFTTQHYRTLDSVEDEVHKHEQQIERIRLALGTRNPTLKSQRDYYRQMAEDPNVEPSDRRLWARLADELDHRLGVQQTEQDMLFDMKPIVKQSGDRT